MSDSYRTQDNISYAHQGALGNDPSQMGAFSGAQITAFVDNVEIGTMTSVTYQIHTEKVAQYTFGSANPRRFVTGKRGIAGSLTFNMFDRAALLSIFAGTNGVGKPLLTTVGSSTSSDFNATQVLGLPSSILSTANFWTAPQPITGASPVQTQNAAFAAQELANNIGSAYNNTFSQPLDYTDQLPPFDLTLAMVDNQGKGAYMVIGGIEIINEGGGFNIDNMTTDVAYTFVARYMRPLTPVSPAGTPLLTGSIPQIKAFPK